MWIDADGVAHTVALPDPRSAFSADMLSTVTAAATADPRRLAELVDDLLEQVYAGLDDATRDQSLVGAALPDGAIVVVADPGSTDAVERVRDSLLAVPEQFRLDALLATEDLVDALDDAARGGVG